MPDSIPYLSNIISALAAGAIGAGASRHMTRRLPGEDEDTYRKRLALNTGIGALGGAATGAALPTIANGMSTMFGAGEPSNNPAKWIGRGIGGIVDGANELVGPLGVIGVGGGAYIGNRMAVKGHDKTVADLKGGTEAAQKSLDLAIKAREVAEKTYSMPAGQAGPPNPRLLEAEARLNGPTVGAPAGAHYDFDQAAKKLRAAEAAGPHRWGGRASYGLGGMLGGMAAQGFFSKYMP